MSINRIIDSDALTIPRPSGTVGAVERQNSCSQITYDLVVVIVNWNVKDLLRDCLESLRAAITGLVAKVVVVDNASSDGSAEMVQFLFPEVDLIRNETNVGFARANNQGLERHQNNSRFLLILNPDTVVSPECFHAMIEFMEQHSGAGIVGCKLIKADGTLDYACKRSYITPDVLLYKALGLDKRFPKNKRFGRYQLTFLDPDHIHEVDSVVGAFLMIRRECAEEIGLLDTSFFMYAEDIEWCYRAKRAGWSVFYVPTATVLHYKGQSTGKCSTRMIFHWYDATWKVYHKQRADRYSPVVNAIVWAGCYGMCGLSLMVNLMRSSKKVPSRR
jgi:GT2 family glycosyltransferase